MFSSVLESANPRQEWDHEEKKSGTSIFLLADWSFFPTFFHFHYTISKVHSHEITFDLYFLRVSTIVCFNNHSSVRQRFLDRFIVSFQKPTSSFFFFFFKVQTIWPSTWVLVRVSAAFQRLVRESVTSELLQLGFSQVTCWRCEMFSFLTLSLGCNCRFRFKSWFSWFLRLLEYFVTLTNQMQTAVTEESVGFLTKISFYTKDFLM